MRKTRIDILLNYIINNSKILALKTLDLTGNCNIDKNLLNNIVYTKNCSCLKNFRYICNDLTLNLCDFQPPYVLNVYLNI